MYIIKDNDYTHYDDIGILSSNGINPTILAINNNCLRFVWEAFSMHKHIIEQLSILGERVPSPSLNK
jgi:hypothetical protein